MSKAEFSPPLALTATQIDKTGWGCDFEMHTRYYRQFCGAIKKILQKMDGV